MAGNTWKNNPIVEELVHVYIENQRKSVITTDKKQDDNGRYPHTEHWIIHISHGQGWI
jgi:hypothetical protein